MDGAGNKWKTGVEIINYCVNVGMSSSLCISELRTNQRASVNVLSVLFNHVWELVSLVPVPDGTGVSQ